MGTCSTKDEMVLGTPPIDIPHVKDMAALYDKSEHYFFRSEHINVFKATDKEAGLNVIVKCISKAFDSYNPANEISVLEKLDKLDNPNIIKMRRYFQTSSHYYIVYNDDNAVSILDHFEASESAFSNREMRKLFKKILKTVFFLHSNGIAHNKLDFSSLYYVPTTQSLSIGGFSHALDVGYAKKAQKAKRLIPYRSKIVIGFQSPEVIQGKVGLKSDIWALGVLFFSLVTGKMPFSGTSKVEFINVLDTQEVDEKLLKEHGASSEIIELITKMLTKKYEPRPSAKDLLNFPFFANGKKSNALKGDVVEQSFNKLNSFSKRSKIVQTIKFQVANLAMVKSEKNIFVKNFQKLDQDKDGKITLKDLLEIRSKVNLQISDQELTSIYEKLDINKTGSIGYTEFVAAFVRLRDDPSNTQLRVVFNAIDTTRNGSISYRELKEFMGDSPETANEIAKLENQFGPEKELSFKEFRDLLHQFDSETS
jgi:serine/threonine protein kinase